MSPDTIDTSFATHALALSAQHWMDIGRGEDALTGTPNDVEEAALRITNILIVRLIAIHHPSKFSDLATSTVAQAVLEEATNRKDPSSCPLTAKITPSLMLQLETYVTCILYGYNSLPFHNFQHAYHVTISANKFIESMLLSAGGPDKRRQVYGLGKDPVSLMALIFAALIHDTGHTGVSNQQRAKDDPDLSLKYSDPSIHEHHSLQMAFDELLKDEYAELRKVMFPRRSHYEPFRALVHNAVLSTDIASPIRAEEAKSKYFEAFPINFDDSMDFFDEDDGPGARRSSMASNISMPRAAHTTKENRRASGQTVSSVQSDLTMDSYSMMKHQNKVSRNTANALQARRRASNGSGASGGRALNLSSSHGGSGGAPKQRRVARRHSIETVDSHFSEFAADSIRMTREKPAGAPQRRASATGAVPQRRLSASHSTDTGLIGLAHERRRDSMKGSMLSNESDFTDVFGKDSMKLTHKRSEGARTTNRRSPNRTKRTNSMDLVGAELGGQEDEYDGDSSLSLTPPSSDDELDGVVISGTVGPASPAQKSTSSPSTGAIDPNDKQTSPTKSELRIARRLSNGGGTPSKILSIKEETAGEFNDMSGNNLDIEGEIFETDLQDVSDDLRAAVVVELCLRAADVAHWYQSWDLMTHFNRRIFMELCEASKNGRGFDPRPNWFDNQAKIMETYLLPLAQQIEFVGVLRRGSGIDLVESLESNNDMWLVRGFDVVEALKTEADK